MRTRPARSPLHPFTPSLVGFALILPWPAVAAGLAGHARFGKASPAGSQGVTARAATWKCGDRSLRLEGVAIAPRGRFSFPLKSRAGRALTLELREFRTAEGQSPAYVVALDGRDLAFRCRKYDGPGPASAFVDLPALAAGTHRVAIRNVAKTPLCLGEAFLWEDPEATVRTRGLWIPMHLGPTVDLPLTPARIRALKALLPDTGDLQPLASLATFAIAQWPPEDTQRRLAEVIRACREGGMPLELQLNTWWAGTPSGCDGQGGRWYDPEYQQVTYDPDAGRFSLSLPNQWSCVPWLTTRHPRLNAFRARQFETAGRFLRAEWDALAGRAAEEFPLFSVVMDNEVTYWGAGMPDAPPRLQADLNPAIVEAAKREGVALDPRDGLGEPEMRFLRHSLRAYNREMAAGLLRGLGRCPLVERAYTHTWMTGWCYANEAQATEAGVLNGVHLGGEWGERGLHLLPVLDLHRELGIPANINCELGGQKDAADVAQLAYAAGCRHITLFNLSDEGVRNTTESLSAGWQEFPPEPWRKVVFREDFQGGEKWKQRFEGAELRTERMYPTSDVVLTGEKVGVSSVARLRANARELTGEPVFTRLALRFRARAFLYRQVSDDSYLAVRAGRDAGSLTEVARLINTGGKDVQVDLTPLVKGSPGALIEFEFHPLGLAGWVCVSECALEIPWEEERLLGCNRSYRADRLRAESLLAAWRAEALWATERLRSAAPKSPALAKAAKLSEAGDYRAAYLTASEAARAALPDTYRPYQPPPADRVERGEARRHIDTAVAYDPYEGGFLWRHVPVAHGCAITLSENDGPAQPVGGNAILGGDDLEITVKAGQAVAIAARRGTARGKVVRFEPATAFALPRLQVEGAPFLLLSSIMTPRGRVTDRKPASCPLAVGQEDFQVGDTVAIRWNPGTGRIVEASLDSRK